mmetsp:Transcript_45374/g.144842  ORF Transcript_45374/g.144842 Transcript_45374/m.144842 type:complete len:362 (+) Transcript_45374:175-1260(+)
MAIWPCSLCQRRATSGAAEEHRRQGNDHYRRGELDDAIAAYSKAISTKPKEGALWLHRSIAYRQKEDWDQAERDAARAVELQPQNEKAVYGRALALNKLGRTPEALIVCNDFLKSDPDNKPLLQLRKNMEQAQKPLADRQGGGKLRETSKPNSAPNMHDIDYSKWTKFEDSDDEQREDRAATKWQGKNPTMEERVGMTEQMLEVSRGHAEEAAVLFPNSRIPENVKLPPDYKGPVGVLNISQLSKFNSNHSRQLVSIYGDVFDVSKRPDQYGCGGPKAFQTGRDITWSVITGKETPESCNRFYDIFKLDDDHCGRYLQLLCQKMVAFENEFGEPVGRLENFIDERDLPPAPIEEIEECKQQ